MATVKNYLDTTGLSRYDSKIKEYINSRVVGSSTCRGEWATWSAVPTNTSLYPEDSAGSRIPVAENFIVVDDSTGYGSTYTGKWLFIYEGMWATVGKNGWKPKCNLAVSFTDAQLAALNSGITASKTEKIDTSVQQKTAGASYVVKNVWCGTQSEYNAITSKDQYTLYFTTSGVMSLGNVQLEIVSHLNNMYGDFTTGNGLDISSAKVISVKEKTRGGITNSSEGLSITTSTGTAIKVDSDGYVTVKVDSTRGIAIDSSTGNLYAVIDTTKAMLFNASTGAIGVNVNESKGLTIDSLSGIQINTGDGLAFGVADASGNKPLVIDLSTNKGLKFVNGKLCISIADNDNYLEFNSSTGALQLTTVKKDLIDGAFQSSNVVTTWETTPSDSKVPSENLTKTYIDQVKAIAESIRLNIVALDYDTTDGDVYALLGSENMTSSVETTEDGDVILVEEITV